METWYATLLDILQTSSQDKYVTFGENPLIRTIIELGTSV